MSRRRAAGGRDDCHVCWVVRDDAAFVERAGAFHAEGRGRGQKTVAFGPEGSASLAALEPEVAIAADPYIAFLDRGPLVPETMFAMFREQTALAHAEGYDGLCLVADMDWLLPLRPAPEAVATFELLLDRVVAELGATVICAYRTSSFDQPTLTGTLAVHPLRSGNDREPPFVLHAADADSWRLAGEVDLAVLRVFDAVTSAAAASGSVVFDVADLGFIDVAGMRTIANLAQAAGTRVRLQGASSTLRHFWQLGEFDLSAPGVDFVT